MSAGILPRRAKELRRGAWIWVAFVAILLALGGAFFTYHAYCRWQGERAITQARSFLEKNDTQNSILSLRTALRYCPQHVEALRALASLLESAHSFEALAHRRTLMDIQPQLLEGKLAYARTALLLDKP
jgi:cytochrome c-type biogenesis protein CcmH/NrfG